MKLYIGTSGYAYKEWKGKFYPKDLPATQMLAYYSERFETVEINSTFYRMPTVDAVKAWAAEVPKDFKFTFKAPQRITHFKRLKDAAEPVNEFLKVTEVLQTRLGPLLFGLPPNFKKDVLRLRDFLKLMPKRSRIAFEFRHESWFDDEVYDLLRGHNVALCIAHGENDFDVPFVATIDWGYVRLRRAEYSKADLGQWVKKIWRQSWSDVYVFFKHEDEATGPRFAGQFAMMIYR